MLEGVKKYFYLLTFSVSIFSGLLFLYSKTQNDFLLHHKDMNRLVLDIRQAETSLDRDLLLIQDFQITNYNSLVAQTTILQELCRYKKDHETTYDESSQEFKLLFEEYCNQMQSKVDEIQNYKTQNEVYRNSLFFLSKYSNEMHSLILTEPGTKSIKHGLHIADVVLNYAILAQEEIRKAAEKIIDGNELKDDATLNQVIFHAKAVLNSKEGTARSLYEIVNSPTRKTLSELSTQYNEQFTKEQKKANFYRNLLFAACLILLLIIIYNVLNLLKAAQALNNANSLLEQRVLERTEQLSQSQKTIVEQQQAVVMVSKLSAIGEMAGGVAHEINTPLAIIQMRADQLLEYLNEEPQDKAMIQSALEAIVKTVTRISKIVNGLRTFARDGSKDPVQPVLINRIVEDTFSLCREKFNNNGVKLQYFSESNIEFECRPGEISQVLLNFLNNAFDAIQSYREKWIRVEAIDTPKNILISITDSGNGIPEEIQEKIMQPFFTTKEIGKGTGLGLSISTGIIEGHGGKIEIDNQSPNTRFVLTIPKYSAMLKPA